MAPLTNALDCETFLQRRKWLLPVSFVVVKVKYFFCQSDAEKLAKIQTNFSDVISDTY